MRPHHPLRRAAAAVLGAALTLTLACTAPAYADELPFGTLNLTVVDDLGKPSVVMPLVYDENGNLEAYLPFDELNPAVPGSSFSNPLPPGRYGIILSGGWGTLTCHALTVCEVPNGGSTTGRPTAAAVEVKTGAVTNLTLTTETPKLTGTGAIGSPLTVALPAGLTTAAASRVAKGLAGSPEPAVTWWRDGVQVAGASGLTYTPTSADRLGQVTARLTYPTIFDLILAGPSAAIVPPPFTTNAVTVGNVAPAVRLALPKRVTAGLRAKAKVSVTVAGQPVGGGVTLKVGRKRAVLATLRNGAATFRLPKLKPGKLRLVATYLGASGYPSASITKSVTVRKANRR